MFLAQLEESYKKSFLELAFAVAEANGIVADEERKIISAYYHELGIEESGYQIIGCSVEEALQGFKDAPKEVKNAIFLEMMYLVLADYQYDEAEKDVVKLLMSYLQVSQEGHDQVVTWVGKMQELYQEAIQFVAG